MLQNKKIIIIAFVFWIVSLGACSPEQKQTSEGVIKYEISYLDDAHDNPLISFMPQNMLVKFKENQTLSVIEGFLGTFKVVFLSNGETGQNISLLRIMGEKLLYKAEPEALAFGYQGMENILIEFTDETKIIAGYSCKKAIVQCPDHAKGKIDVFYTEQINILNPNQNNPFREIKGTLMEFQVLLNGMNMKIKAIEVKSMTVDNEVFEIPEGYEQKSFENVAEFVSGFMDISEK